MHANGSEVAASNPGVPASKHDTCCICVARPVAELLPRIYSTGRVTIEPTEDPGGVLCPGVSIQ